MKTLQPHQQRVVDEKDALDDKIAKLAFFIGSFQKPNSVFAGLPEPERQRLYAQHRAMVTYSTILGERIAAFVTDAPSAEVYSRTECRFNYCASPGICQGTDRCANERK
ncbi:hypothetical protein WK57_30400 [Burkholderia ubonensis]|uniref:Uncharacterized protein n=1 Tax=Burkholderia ubonensis TaxID=101571 RepID=A0AA40R5Z0_9BURK|nr:hypothetical protein [Burkholderia ubonensis]KWZ53301.1 hypothetical protein WK57_30400 [Burkholderia ubonensis]